MSKNDTDDKPAFFVSRRGRKIGVHEVDLGGIDVDHELSSGDKETQSTTKVTKQHGREKIPKKTSSPSDLPVKRRWSRKKIVVLTGLLLVLLLPLALAEFITAEYYRGVTQSKNDFQELVQETVLPAQKKSTLTADQVRDMAGNVNEIAARMCRGSFFDNAADLYPRARAALQECKSLKTRYTSLTTSLYTLENQARYLERIAVLLKPATTPITDEYAVIGAQQSSWISIADEVRKISPPTSMISAHTSLVAHTKAAADAWSKLSTANNQQDSLGFQEAEKALAIEYEAIRGTALVYNDILSDSQAKINSTYAALR